MDCDRFLSHHLSHFIFHSFYAFRQLNVKAGKYVHEVLRINTIDVFREITQAQNPYTFLKRQFS
jgi:hypothetical protein